MNLLEQFIKEYHDRYKEEKHVYENSIEGTIKKVQDALLDEKFLPSIQLKNLFDKLLRRARYPMEVAITGQFSSGKSTFLNALLTKDILPTGITPVTSKVNFINYGQEYKLKVTYKSGAQEYHGVENIAKFTDQRLSVEDIKYLTIYAPMEILKDISFVDTPGLNSLSEDDTATTRKVLRDVEGIIWLTLMDNAGKISEAKVLEQYLENFKNKSLCVLNQKDKFTAKQIETTTSYVEDKFSEFFSKVIPISAKQALESRVHQKSVLINDATLNVVKKFKESIHKNLDMTNFFEDEFSEFKDEINRIKNRDNSNDYKKMQESNISAVLDFIEDVIRPAAIESKAYTIKKELRSICDILVKEYETTVGVYESLESILKEQEQIILGALNKIHEKNLKKLVSVFNSLEIILEEIAREILSNIKRVQKYRYKEEEGGFLNKIKIEKHQYETYDIDSDTIYKNLFYDDQTIDKMVVKSMKLLKDIEIMVAAEFRDVYDLQERAVKKWQEPYELIKKHREIASDLEFANTRMFAAKVYENILTRYRRAINGNITALRKKFAYFNGIFSYSYRQTTGVTISHFEQKIAYEVAAFENDPTKFTVSMPNEDEIFERLQANFGFDKIESFLTSDKNYIYKIIEYAKDEYLKINIDRSIYIREKKELYLSKLEDIKDIKNSIV